MRVFFPTIPCEKTITYSIGDFDTRFGITRTELLETARQAEKVWESATGYELFASETDGSVKINLIYDHRQQATSKLGTIGVSIGKDKTDYTNLAKEYESLRAEYEEKKKAYERNLAEFNHTQKEAQTLNRQVEELNSLSEKLNNTGNELNQLADKLNIKVDKYNEIGASAGEEFNEGEYVLDDTGERIDIYQFTTDANLRRLLEHEFGHALGLDHVKSPDSIMYRLNSSPKEKLTPDDLQEFRSACPRLMASK